MLTGSQQSRRSLGQTHLQMQRSVRPPFTLGKNDLFVCLHDKHGLAEKIIRTLPHAWKLCAGPVLELLCSIMQVDTACVTMLTDKGTFIKDGVGVMEPGKLHTTAGVCQWTLVPEKPQAMVVEDMLEDARCAAAWHTSLALLFRIPACWRISIWDCKMQAKTGGHMAHCHLRFICPTCPSARKSHMRCPQQLVCQRLCGVLQDEYKVGREGVTLYALLCRSPSSGQQWS